MDFCSKCGATTDPDWVFCRACGSDLDLPDVESSSPPASIESESPKVELISRGWDVVELSPEDDLPDPLDSDVIEVPLPPGAVEIVVDEIAVVDVPQPEEAGASPTPAVAKASAEPTGPTEVTADAWDHLRPHGEVPRLLKPSKAPIRFSQTAVLLFSMSAVVAAALYLYFNTQLDAFATGQVSPGALADVEATAQASLIVLAGLAVIALGTMLWWILKRDKRLSLRPGISGVLAPLTAAGGAALVGFFVFTSQNTVADAMTANTYVILGLGLLMLAGLAVVRTIGRIEHRKPSEPDRS